MEKKQWSTSCWSTENIEQTKAFRGEMGMGRMRLHRKAIRRSKDNRHTLTYVTSTSRFDSRRKAHVAGRRTSVSKAIRLEHSERIVLRRHARGAARGYNTAAVLCFGELTITWQHHC